MRSDDGSYLKMVLNDREKRTVTLVDGDPNEDGEFDIPEKIWRLYHYRNRLEEKMLQAFRIICDDVKTNRERINACMSHFMNEEDAE